MSTFVDRSLGLPILLNTSVFVLTYEKWAKDSKYLLPILHVHHFYDVPPLLILRIRQRYSPQWTATEFSCPLQLLYANYCIGKQGEKLRHPKGELWSAWKICRASITVHTTCFFPLIYTKQHTIIQNINNKSINNITTIETPFLNSFC